MNMSSFCQNIKKIDFQIENDVIRFVIFSFRYILVITKLFRYNDYDKDDYHDYDLRM